MITFHQYKLFSKLILRICSKSLNFEFSYGGKGNILLYCIFLVKSPELLNRNVENLGPPFFQFSKSLHRRFSLIFPPKIHGKAPQWHLKLPIHGIPFLFPRLAAQAVCLILFHRPLVIHLTGQHLIVGSTYRRSTGLSTLTIPTPRNSIQPTKRNSN